MTNFNNLPDLVIHLIIKQVCYMCNDGWFFKGRLPLIAVNRRFRQIGFPSVNDSLYLETISSSEERITNCIYFKDPGRRSCVRSLELGHPDIDNKLHVIVRLLVNLVNSLDGTAKEESRWSDKEIVAMGPEAIGGFAVLFPNIRHVSITANSSGEDGRAFNTTWVDVLERQLTSFHTSLQFEENIAQHHLDLARFSCICNEEPESPLPMLNPLTLACLHLHDPPSNFISQCFQPEGGVVVFPNLVDLRITFGEKSHIERMELMEARPVQLQLPKLRNFDVGAANIVGTVFWPGLSLNHLDTLKFCGDDLAFPHFGSLPIKFVGCMDVNLCDYMGPVDDTFYQIANRLFGEVTVFRESTLHIETGLLSSLDPGRFSWTNITNLELVGINPYYCIWRLAKLPFVKKLLISYKWTNREMTFGGPFSFDEEGQFDLSSHGLQKLIILKEGNWDKEDDDYDDDYDEEEEDEEHEPDSRMVAKVTMALATRIVSLQEIYISNGELFDFLYHGAYKKKVNEAGRILRNEIALISDRYPHLKTIRVYDDLTDVDCEIAFNE